jgi:hypothetical protein
VPTTNVIPGVSLVSPVNGAAATNRTLSWTYSANGGAAQTQYNVQVANDSGFTGIISTGPSSGGQTSAQIPSSAGLVYDNTYYWRVQVFNGNHWSAWSATWSFVFHGGPTATVASPVGAASTGSRTLTWTYHANGGPAQTGYKVELATDSNFGAILISTVFTWDPNGSYTIPGSTTLTDGAVYYWHVAVSDGYAGSPWSPSGSFTWAG